MLPKFDLPGLPARLQEFYDEAKANDAAFGKVHDEIMGALAAWDERGRWDNFLGVGVRDTAPPTLFDKILAREIPAEIVYETDQVLAFKDIKPAARKFKRG